MPSRKTIPFTASPRSSVGVEWEIALVDRDSRDLRQVAQIVLDAVRQPDGSPSPSIRKELLLKNGAPTYRASLNVRGGGSTAKSG